jgi:ComF family protein
MTTPLTMGLRTVAAALGKALFPDKCILCKEFFIPKSGDFMGGTDAIQRALKNWLCQACLADCEAISTPFCPRCGLPFIGDVAADHLCGDCRTRPGTFERARSAGPYAGALKALIRLFKFQGRVGLALPLGHLLLETFERHWTPDHVDLILPVPLSARRMRRRGYNQAHLLVRRWAGWYQAVHHHALPCRIQNDLLRRVRATLPQTGLNRAARAQNLKNAFALVRPQICEGQRILLVDDILTTGATVNACARVLRDAGARQVEVLTLARVV